MRTEQGRLTEALPFLRKRLAESENAIVESNSIVEFVQPDLYMTVLDPGVEDFKASAQRFLECADAVILPRERLWNHASRQRAFRISPPEYVTADMVKFVNQRLQELALAAG